jgi:diacylglycerol kinase (ATP)
MKRLVLAFFNSMAAIRFGMLHEPALRQEMLLVLASMPLALLLTSDPWKLAALLASVLLVLIVEFLNTGIEKLADRVTRQEDPLIRIAKDCGSAAVLISLAIAALVWSVAALEWLAWI